MFTPANSDRAWTVTVEPSVDVSAKADMLPTESTAGASKPGMVASAADVPPSALTWAWRPGAGSETATGSPTPELAVMRNG